MGAAAEAFLDQLVTWRELGFNFAAHRDDGERYESAARRGRWRRSPSTPPTRAHTSTPSSNSKAPGTHDPLWNAARPSSVREGTHPQLPAHAVGEEDPRVVAVAGGRARRACSSSTTVGRSTAATRTPASGIFWCLGRYDRPWGPERPVFGTVRYMSSANTARKLRLARYLARYGDGAGDSGARYPA